MTEQDPIHASWSRRERQIMDVLFRLGRASAAEVHARIPDAPSLTAVRTMLRTLESKGHVRHEKHGARFIYMAAGERRSAERSAVKHLLRTFFGGSAGAAVAALLDASERPLSSAERAELVALIRRERSAGR